MGFALIPMEEWLWMLFGSFSAIIHCIVLITIYRARQSRTESFFRGPFFTIVLIQGVHEILEFLTVNLINRFRKYQIIYYTLEEDNNLVEWQWYWYGFIKNILYLGHIGIATNRLSAFVLTGVGAYDKIWNTKVILVLISISYLISGILRAVVYYPDLKCRTSVYNTTGTFSLTISNDNIDIILFDNTVDIALSSSSAILCCIFYIITTFFVRQYRTESLNTKKQELLLLKVGIATLIILLPTPIRSAIELWGSYTGHNDVKTFVSRITYVPTEAMCVCQPWLLLISCASLRGRLVHPFKDRIEESTGRAEKNTISQIVIRG